MAPASPLATCGLAAVASILVEDEPAARARAGASLFERLGSPTNVLSPMVDQSELPFRLLARRYGAQLCFTPMVNANQFTKSAAYREEVMGGDLSGDRPLVVQFAGHDADTLLQAGRYVEHMCDAVDLNLGCPQGIARRGRYGAYLLEEEDVVVDIVSKLSAGLAVPVTCKIRLFRDDLERTLRLCRRLQDAGCAMLTVHGRTRYQNKQTVGACDFGAIAAVKRELRIPVVANGGIETFADVRRCLEKTGADAVMSSEAALENPALFCGNRDSEGRYVDQNRLVREYLDLAQRHLPGSGGADGCPKCVRAHVFKMLFAGLQEHTDLRDRVQGSRSLEEYREVAAELEGRGWSQPMHSHELYACERSWYYRHRLEPTGEADAGTRKEDEEEEEEPEMQFYVCWE